MGVISLQALSFMPEAQSDTKVENCPLPTGLSCVDYETFWLCGAWH
ncbi:hypothetical protein Nmel_002995 [Mimus melanotis]